MKDFLPSGYIVTSNNTDLDSYFGFCYCTVKVPDYLDKPILPYRYDQGNICNPIVSRSGWYPAVRPPSPSPLGGSNLLVSLRITP